MKRMISAVIAVCVMVSLLAFAASAERRSFVFFEYVSLDDTSITVDLCVKDVADKDISSFGFYIDGKNAALESWDFDEDMGEPTFYDIMGNVSDEPFIISGIPSQMKWTFADDHSATRDKVVVGRLTFRLDAPVSEADTKISLAMDFTSLPTDKSGNAINKGVIFVGMDIVDGVISELPQMDPIPGDANGDEKVSLADASAMLQFIADWKIGVDLEQSDVNKDGNVNLTDVSMIMKYIAGWNIELK